MSKKLFEPLMYDQPIYLILILPIRRLIGQGSDLNTFENGTFKIQNGNKSDFSTLRKKLLEISCRVKCYFHFVKDAVTCIVAI